MVSPARTWSSRTLVAVVATLLVTAGAGWSSPARAADPLTDQVTVVMAVPAGTTQDGTTLQQVVDAVNGPVADYWNRQSGGAIRIGVTGQVDWYQSSASCTDAPALWTDAAHRAGWTAGPGKRLLVYVPTGAPCGAFESSRRWPPYDGGGQMYVAGQPGLTTTMIAEALGSDLGLPPDTELECNGRIDSGDCGWAQGDTAENYDGWDVGQFGSLSVPQLDRLGLLPVSQQRTVDYAGDSATVTLAPVSGTTGTRAVRMVAPDGVYWLEYRPASGQDAWLSTAANTRNLKPGVLLRLVKGSDIALLDPTPPATWYNTIDHDAAMPVGSPVQVDGGTFTITVTAISATDAAVRITTDPSLRGWTPAANRLPTGNLDAASFSGNTLTVRGWAIDADQPVRPVTVDVYVDGSASPNVSLLADESRPDVGAAFPQAGDQHGFSGSVTLAPGAHTVCVAADDPQQPSSQTQVLLGCNPPRPPQSLPIGHWDSVSSAGTTLSLSGWAFDPDTPAPASAVHVYVDGRFAAAVTADAVRPDVGAAFIWAGAAHGFSWSTSLAPGVHTVCLYAIDQQAPSTHSDLGCRQVPVAMTLPVGSWDSATVNGTTLSVAGWAFDPDSATQADQVHVYVDGQGTALTANGSRPDVGAAYPGAGGAHGVSWSTSLAPGEHTVCVYAIDQQVPSTHTDLGCRAVTVALTLPRGSLDSVSVSGTTLSMGGWAFDPDSPTQADQVHVYVDGRWGTALTADQSRPDVGAAFPQAGAAHGFGWTTTMAPGTHSVCSYAIDVQVPSTHTDLGCRTVTATATH